MGRRGSWRLRCLCLLDLIGRLLALLRRSLPLFLAARMQVSLFRLLVARLGSLCRLASILSGLLWILGLRVVPGPKCKIRCCGRNDRDRLLFG
jgi:hypothetical protein